MGVSPSQADTARPAGGQLPVDLVVIGAGIMGLWAAFEAGRAGMTVALIDRAHVGGGASGGLLGALMPHMPDRWSDKKQFQFDALVSLEGRVGFLEAMTGLSAGYRRTGRLIPLPKPHLRDIALRHCRDAGTVWQTPAHRFDWRVVDTPPVSGWVAAEAGSSGFVHDTLAARVSPRGLTGVLRAALSHFPKVRLVEGDGVTGIDPAGGAVLLSSGDRLAFGACIVAAGVASFSMLEGLGPALRKPLGQPVKGQAALLRADVDPGLPVVFLDGLYVVAHEGGHVAIGSTSENRFDAPFSTDGQLDALIARARDLVPVLADCPVIERWAGLRPKAIDRDPMVGRHPDHSRIVALTGGFKVSFGLAHRLADAALAAVAGRTMGVPESFTLDHHLAVAAAGED